MTTKLLKYQSFFLKVLFTFITVFLLIVSVTRYHHHDECGRVHLCLVCSHEDGIDEFSGSHCCDNETDSTHDNDDNCGLNLDYYLSQDDENQTALHTKHCLLCHGLCAVIIKDIDIEYSILDNVFYCYDYVVTTLFTCDSDGLRAPPCSRFENHESFCFTI